MTRRYGIPKWMVAVGMVTLVGLSFTTSGLVYAAEGRSAKAVPPTNGPPTEVPPTTAPPTTAPPTTAPPTTTQAWVTPPDLPLLNTPVAIPLPPLPVSLPEIPPLVTNRPVAQPPRPAPLPPPPAPASPTPTVGPRSVPTPSPPVATAPPLPTVDITPAEGTSTSPGRDRPGFAPELKKAVKAFTIPLMLTIIVGLFLVLQTHFDRRDPKLVAAPVVDDLHTFR